MPRIATLTALLCAALALALPAPAPGAKTQSLTFEARRDLLDPAVRPTALSEIGAFGVRSLRLVLYWHDVAPDADARVKPTFDDTQPGGYDWSRYDAAIDAARASGIGVLLTLSGPVPRWATNGAKDTLTRPSPMLFGRFVQAAARHFGARVERWSIWNEPNQPQFLKPQYSASHKPLSPGIYRRLFVAAQRGLRDAGVANAQVLLGETSPRGTGKVVAPLTFLRKLLCLSKRYRSVRRCARLDVAGYAHHAYTTRQGPSFRPPQPNDVTIGVLARLTRALDRAASAGALPRRLPIYLTEFGIESAPDPLRGVSLKRQSEYRAISERIAYDNPRVVSFSQYLMRDDLPRSSGPAIARYPGFESGLKTFDGVVKPSFDGFRLPLAVRRRGSRVSIWGLVRPAGGPTTVTIEYRSGRRWRTLATVTTNARGYVARRAAYMAGRQWRLVWTAPDGTTFNGTATRAYR